MDKREKRWIKRKPDYMHRYGEIQTVLEQDYNAIMRYVMSVDRPRYVYLDRLTKKQQCAIAMIDIAGLDSFVHGVGGKTKCWVHLNGVDRFREAYLLDC